MKKSRKETKLLPFLSDSHNRAQTLRLDKVPLLCDPAHVFLGYFFLDSFPEDPHPLLHDVQGEKWAQLPWRSGGRSGVRGQASGAMLGGQRGSSTGCAQEDSGRINKHL